MSDIMSDLRFWPRVYQAILTDGFQLFAYCNDGAVREINIMSLVKPGAVYEFLEDSNLRKMVTVSNETVAWKIGSKHIELDPFFIFDQPIVPDPLDVKKTDR